MTEEKIDLAFQKNTEREVVKELLNRIDQLEDRVVEMVDMIENNSKGKRGR